MARDQACHTKNDTKSEYRSHGRIFCDPFVPSGLIQTLCLALHAAWWGLHAATRRGCPATRQLKCLNALEPFVHTYVRILILLSCLASLWIKIGNMTDHPSIQPFARPTWTTADRPTTECQRNRSQTPSIKHNNKTYHKDISENYRTTVTQKPERLERHDPYMLDT